jgi:alpha-L-fucosidase
VRPPDDRRRERETPARSDALSRRAFLAIGAGAAALGPRALGRLGLAAQPVARPVPRPEQLEWQRDELALFLHFGVNTFTDREWGDGKEEPAIFAPERLDARQWARAAKAAGFRTLILTAKHHDGFCLWPTATTEHSVRRSPWRGGSGDVVRALVDACRAEGLKPGVYCSPWDRNAPSYGDSPRYNDLYAAQLTELLTRYGPMHEVWFDGANGEGPNGRKQVYDWPRVWSLVRRLAPQAVIFSDAGPDIRWIGNERGAAGETNWSTMDPDAVPYPGADGPGIVRALQTGDPAGTVWRPGETDVSIRPGWFYHPAEDAKVKSVDDLVDIYFSSVGRNSKLLLNVPPTREGLLHPTDVARLQGMHERLTAMFAEDVAAGRRPTWQTTGARSGLLEIALGRSVPVRIIDLREDIARGQVVSGYRVEGQDAGGTWRTLSRGTTIGYRKLDRVTGAPVRRVRVTIEGRAQLDGGTMPIMRMYVTRLP